MPETDDIDELGVNEDTAVQTGESRSTGWAGPCVLFHVPGTQPRLGHYSNLGINVDDGNLKAFLQRAKESLGERMKVTVRGGHVFGTDPEGLARQLVTRTKVVSLLDDTGFTPDQLDIEWGANNEKTQIVCDGATGEIRIVSVPSGPRAKKRVQPDTSDSSM